MKEVIMIKYAELTTKKDNRNFFINTLEKNVLSCLDVLNPTIKKDYYRMFIYVSDIESSISKLSKVFGIHEIVRCVFTEDVSLENIENISKTLIKEGSTFKVITNRSDKTYPINSMELSRMVGAYLLKNVPNLKVDVHEPSTIVNIEIRREGVYLYSSGIPGMGGYPTGTLGKALLMLSGGIDSVVAGFLTMKRGVKLDFLYFESLPHTSLEARDKVISLAKILKSYGNTGKLLVVPFTKIQETIYKEMKGDYMITMMRRQMYKIATKVAKMRNANAIVNGESIGQVASQTLTSMKVVNDVTNYPIIRPLASFDKLEIMDIARKIGSYDISILPYIDCCTVFVPPHPVINPRLDVARSEEEKMDESLLDEAIKNIIKIDLNEENLDNDLLQVSFFEKNDKINTKESDNIKEKVTLDFILKVNSYVSRNESLSWGELRTGNVGISGTDYIPKIPEENVVKEDIKKILEIPDISKVIILVKDDDLLEFNKLLTEYYTTGVDIKIIEFLYNKCVYGLE